MRPPSEMAADLRARGRSVTPQRWAVLEALASAPDAHFTTEDLYRQVHERLPTVSLRTIYEIVHLLVDVGQLHPLDLGTGSTHYDPDPGVHAHAVCSRCRGVEHVPVDAAALADLIPDEGGAWAAIVVHRLCAACSDAREP